MKRREVLTLLGSAAAWPLAARAQPSGIPVVGFLNPGSFETLRPQVAAIHMGLKESGFVEGDNVAMEYRFAEGQFDRLPALAADLIRRQVAVVIAGSTAALVAKQATTSVPIVFNIGADPVEVGLVASLNRPGGNITGIYQFTTGLEAKRLGLLRELVPAATTMAALIHPNFSSAEIQLRDVRQAAASLSVQLIVVRANVVNDLYDALASVMHQRAGALLVCGSPFFNGRREQLIVLAARHALPAIYERREFATAGGLMS
jgi:ABC-type uncharacterized transport system substrate-binding protein